MDLAEPTLQNRIYAVIAETARSAPAFRGKIRIAEKLYDLCNPNGRPFHVKTRLYDDSLDFHLNLNCGHERAALLMDGYELETIDFLCSIYSGGSILDIGANIGLISLPLAKRLDSGEEARIFAIEALPTNYAKLCTNVRENALTDKILPMNFAMGDIDRALLQIQVEGDDLSETGTANILADARLGGTKFCAGDFRMSGLVKMEIMSRTIDSLVEQASIRDDVGLIKIDADGYDFNVLKGASALLTTARPIIFSEMAAYCLNWHDQKISDVISFAREHRYQVWAKHPRRFRFSDRFDPETFESDMLLMPVERREQYESWIDAP